MGKTALFVFVLSVQVSKHWLSNIFNILQPKESSFPFFPLSWLAVSSLSETHMRGMKIINCAPMATATVI